MRMRLLAWWEVQWQKFILLAQGPHAIFWLAFCAVADPIFFPIAPEIYLTALVLAHPARWRTYLATAIPFSVLGAGLGYLVGYFLFSQLGLPLISAYHLGGAFEQTQALFHDKVFLTMVLIAFSLIPEKVVVLAAGFLGVSFPPFILGFFVGRAVRISLVVYLTHRFGMQALAIAKRYLIVFTLIILAIAVYYGMVHFHVLPSAVSLWARPL